LRVLFLVNARSGPRRRDDLQAVIQANCLDWSYDVAACGTREELPGLISHASAEGVEVIYAVGGDGTIHEIARHLIGTSMALGVLPRGSGNGFARHLGLPLQPAAALQACRGLRIETIDTATVNDRPFVGVMGLGFDAWIAEAFAGAGTRGMRTYVRVGLQGFRRFEAQDYSIRIDGETIERRALIVAVANSSQYGNNARIAPLASLQDGLLDITIIERVPILGAPLLLARLFSGSVHRSPGVTTRTGRRVQIVRARAGAAHLDGEPVTLPDTMTVEIVPRSLQVIVPDRSRTR
ncbi:MAG: YegS/Rv2252/BmrU family lipid kinase, partial [Thermoanaerobaculia bacterium]